MGCLGVLLIFVGLIDLGFLCYVVLVWFVCIYFFDYLVYDSGLV